MRDETTEELIRRELPGPGQEAARELAGAVGRLVAALRPERVYVFGSQARGTAHQGSDVDLLVVVSESSLSPHQRDQAAYRAVGVHTTPLDILVMTREEFERRAPAPTSLPALALPEGPVLYAA